MQDNQAQRKGHGYLREPQTQTASGLRKPQVPNKLKQPHGSVGLPPAGLSPGDQYAEKIIERMIKKYGTYSRR